MKTQRNEADRRKLYIIIYKVFKLAPKNAWAGYRKGFRFVPLAKGAPLEDLQGFYQKTFSRLPIH